MRGVMHKGDGYSVWMIAFIRLQVQQHLLICWVLVIEQTISERQHREELTVLILSLFIPEHLSV